MPSKHYLPEMSDSPLHWVTRPLRNSTLRHTRRRRPAVRWFPTTARRSTGTLRLNSTRRVVPPSSSTPPTHRPTTILRSRASRRRGKSSAGGRRSRPIERKGGCWEAGGMPLRPAEFARILRRAAGGNAARRRIGREEGARGNPRRSGNRISGRCRLPFWFRKTLRRKMPRSGTPATFGGCGPVRRSDRRL